MEVEVMIFGKEPRVFSKDDIVIGYRGVEYRIIQSYETSLFSKNMAYVVEDLSTKLKTKVYADSLTLKPSDKQIEWV